MITIPSISFMIIIILSLLLGALAMWYLIEWLDKQIEKEMQEKEKRMRIKISRIINKQIYF